MPQLTANGWPDPIRYRLDLAYDHADYAAGTGALPNSGLAGAAGDLGQAVPVNRPTAATWHGLPAARYALNQALNTGDGGGLQAETLIPTDTTPVSVVAVGEPDEPHVDPLTARIMVSVGAGVGRTYIGLTNTPRWVYQLTTGAIGDTVPAPLGPHVAAGTYDGATGGVLNLNGVDQLDLTVTGTAPTGVVSLGADVLAFDWIGTLAYAAVSATQWTAAELAEVVAICLARAAITPTGWIPDTGRRMRAQLH